MIPHENVQPHRWSFVDSLESSLELVESTSVVEVDARSWCSVQSYTLLSPYCSEDQTHLQAVEIGS